MKWISLRSLIWRRTETASGASGPMLGTSLLFMFHSNTCLRLLKQTSQTSCEALKMALGRRGPVPGLIHHSDRGSQYAGGKYRKLINKGGLTQSMSRKGECLDNAPMESFFASLKKELVHRWRFKTRAEAKAAIFEYIEAFLIISAGTHASDIKHHSRLFKI
jgi:hypothetical protein